MIVYLFLKKSYLTLSGPSLPAVKVYYPSHVHGHGLYGTSLTCSFFLIIAGGFGVYLFFVSLSVCRFFASNIDDVKSTIHGMGGAQLLSHACQSCVSASPLLGIRKHL